MSDADNGNGYACVRDGGYMGKISVPSSLFCYKSKAALKNIITCSISGLGILQS